MHTHDMTHKDRALYLLRDGPLDSYPFVEFLGWDVLRQLVAEGLVVELRDEHYPYRLTAKGAELAAKLPPLFPPSNPQ